MMLQYLKTCLITAFAVFGNLAAFDIEQRAWSTLTKQDILWKIDSSMGGVSGDHKKVSAYLRRLELGLMQRIVAIKEQLANQYCYDQQILKYLILIGVVTCLSGIMAYYMHRKWQDSSEYKAFEDIKAQFKKHGIRIFDEVTYSGSYKITTTFAENEKDISFLQFSNLCDEYKTLDDKCTKARTIWGEGSKIVTLAGLIYGIPLCCMELYHTDPNADNKNLDHYEDLLEFVRILQKEYA